jgi:hypothetical protein
MNPDIARLNIDHFHKLLVHETDEAKRRVIHHLLVEEENKLRQAEMNFAKNPKG